MLMDCQLLVSWVDAGLGWCRHTCKYGRCCGCERARLQQAWGLAAWV